MLPLQFLIIIIYFLLRAVKTNFDFKNSNENNTKENFILYKHTRNKIELIRSECGSLCNIDHSLYKPIPDDSKFYYIPIQREVDCQKLWNCSGIDEKSKFKRAPQKIPKYLQGYFTHNSSLVNIKSLYFDEISHGIWNETFNTWGKYMNAII